MNGLIVLARQASHRLPLKHMYPIDGVRSSLEVLLGRLSGANVDMFVLATGSSDTLYQDLAKELKWEIFASGYVRDENVLERIWRASFGYSKIVIVNGDSPLINASMINKALDSFNDLDCLACSGPSGFRIKVITGMALEKWYRWTLAQALHPLSGLIDPPGLSVDRYHLGPCEERFTIDEYEDVRFIRGLVAKLGADKDPQDYIGLVNNNPDFRARVAQGDASLGGFATAG